MDAVILMPGGETSVGSHEMSEGVEAFFGGQQQA